MSAVPTAPDSVPISTVDELPRVGYDAIEFVAHYHDGPLSGLCRVGEEVHAFVAAEPEAATAGLLVYPLSEDECARELRVKELFEIHVGTYWSWDVPRAERTPCAPGGFSEFQAAVAAEFGSTCGDVADYRNRRPVAVIA